MQSRARGVRRHYPGPCKALSHTASFQDFQYLVRLCAVDSILWCRAPPLGLLLWTACTTSWTSLDPFSKLALVTRLNFTATSCGIGHCLVERLGLGPVHRSTREMSYKDGLAGPRRTSSVTIHE